jgi:hypothetical protein
VLLIRASIFHRLLYLDLNRPRDQRPPRPRSPSAPPCQILQRRAGNLGHVACLYSAESLACGSDPARRPRSIRTVSVRTGSSVAAGDGTDERGGSTRRRQTTSSNGISPLQNAFFEGRLRWRVSTTRNRIGMKAAARLNSGRSGLGDHSRSAGDGASRLGNSSSKGSQIR